MHKRLFARTIAIVACALPALWGGAASAQAAPGADVFVATITGTITPGISPTGCTVQTDIAFDSTSALLVGDDTQSGSIDFNGESISCETVTAGTGVGTINGLMNGLISYNRNGPVFSFFGNVEINGVTHTIFDLLCVVFPTSIQPADTYAGVCAGLFTS